MDVFAFILALVAIVMYGLYHIAKAGVAHSDAAYGASDTELIQQVNRSLLKMEQRIETLETLLADHAGRKTPRFAEYAEAQAER
jgi:phage shock protein B